jgi:hypothetical protein
MMKKVLALFLGIILFFSCDPPAYYDYFIINQCDEEINVYIESDWEKFGSTYNIVISSNENSLIYHGEDFQGVSDLMVETFFKKITISKGDNVSKVNYINKDLWDFQVTSKDHANSYLTVKPEDFE